MNRRQFSLLLAGAAASTLVPASSLAEESTTNSAISSAAKTVYARSLVLDGNCAPPLNDGKLPFPQSQLDLARQSGVNVLKLTLGGINDDFVSTVGFLAFVQRMCEVHPDYFMQVRVASDFERAKRENKLGIIFSFESADMLNGDLDRIEIFRDLGVRVMQLSYNKKSPFGAGVMAPEAGGLTELGRKAVDTMNKVGIAIDLSHANPATTADAIAVSKKPVVMTHGGCSAIHRHPRNKTDEQLRALADKGGVLGIYDLPYLTASPKQPTVDDYMAHMEHALKVMGEDHVGVGSDAGLEPFDTSPQGLAEFNKAEEQRQKSGLAAPEEDRPTYVTGLNIPRRIEVITDQLLKRGYSERVTEKVIGGNFVRVFGEIWT
ncbi:MAG TPA: membrane dipeptidase [Terriglobales bacterium]|nr:membrane dipeptidase [Terriglobales bacterium]